MSFAKNEKNIKHSYKYKKMQLQCENRIFTNNKSYRDLLQLSGKQLKKNKLHSFLDSLFYSLLLLLLLPTLFTLILLMSLLLLLISFLEILKTKTQLSKLDNGYLESNIELK